MAGDNGEESERSESLVRYFVFFNKFAEAELNKNLLHHERWLDLRGEKGVKRKTYHQLSPSTFQNWATVILSTLSDNMSAMCTKASNWVQWSNIRVRIVFRWWCMFCSWLILRRRNRVWIDFNHADRYIRGKRRERLTLQSVSTESIEKSSK